MKADPGLLGGRYRLLDVIGRGGMAEVRRATDTKLGRPVAVKLLLDGTGEDDDRTRFIAEARMLARLSHTGLVTVFDAGFGAASATAEPPGSPGQAVLVMELVEGATMAQLMADGPLPLAEVAAIGAQVAEALAYVHARGVVHRDIKPANVLRDKDERVKLADFGIARLLGQTSRNTRPGQAVGTAAYLAPEQVQGGDVDGAADVYALGLVLLEAITGRREYAGSTTEAALARLTRPPAIPAGLPPAWRELLTAMTQIDPALRPSADDVATTLRTGASEAPVGVATPPDPTVSEISADDAGGPTQAMLVLPDRVGRLRTSPADAAAIAAVLAALVLLLVVAGLAADDGDEPTIPDDTPSELRQPLEDLHEAVNGDEG